MWSLLAAGLCRLRPARERVRWGFILEGPEGAAGGRRGWHPLGAGERRSRSLEQLTRSWSAKSPQEVQKPSLAAVVGQRQRRRSIGSFVVVRRRPNTPGTFRFVVAGSVLAGLVCGRLDRSAMPALPSAR